MAVVDIVIEAEGWGAPEPVEALVSRAAAAALAASGVKTLPDAELAVLLTDDAAIADLNRQWRGKSGPTNVLSFPAAEGDRLATSPVIGDIALGLETCAREAEDEGKAFFDHVAHLVVHGALHLVGFDHETEAQAVEMETLERTILAGLGIADPYRTADGAEA